MSDPQLSPAQLLALEFRERAEGRGPGTFSEAVQKDWEQRQEQEKRAEAAHIKRCEEQSRKEMKTAAFFVVLTLIVLGLAIAFSESPKRSFRSTPDNDPYFDAPRGQTSGNDTW